MKFKSAALIIMFIAMTDCLASIAARYTTTIGTIYHPTMDGGMINSSDGLKPMPSVNDIKKSDHKISFDDHWAKSEKVAHVLNNAARNGKLQYVLNESKKRGMPASVAVVPVVESRYNDTSISPKGAGGAWQLMPALAKDYHLADHDRYNFEKSTPVALDHLGSLHDRFGNWTLAFAAYNAGLQRVITAMRLSPHAKSIDELNLPQETKQYVAKIASINRALMDL